MGSIPKHLGEPKRSPKRRRATASDHLPPAGFPTLVRIFHLKNPPMIRRTFGNTPISKSPPSRWAAGSSASIGGDITRRKTATALCNFSLDQGITFFDNGDAYGNGRAETLFGQWMKDAKIDREQDRDRRKVRLRLLLRSRRGRARIASASRISRRSSCALRSEQSLQAARHGLLRSVHGPQHQAAAVPR